MNVCIRIYVGQNKSRRRTERESESARKRERWCVHDERGKAHEWERERTGKKGVGRGRERGRERGGRGKGGE